jgi:hypothetical protein
MEEEEEGGEEGRRITRCCWKGCESERKNGKLGRGEVKSDLSKAEQNG